MVAALTPAQAEVLAVLRARDRPRPSVDPGLRAALRGRLESELAPLAGTLAEPVFVHKGALGQVHSCEAHHLAEAAAPFEWSLRSARGTVAHKAIELSIHRRGDAFPLELVDEALDRLADDPDATIASFLVGLSEGERAELRSEVNDMVSKFRELWPPLRPRWAPRTESRLRAELCGGMVQLSGKVDLALGTASGTTPGALVVDLKTGGSYSGHLDDLRFYALLETLRVGVPPFRLAGYYLDAGTFLTEEVTGEVLEAAVLRTVAGVRAILELRLGLRSASVTANPACRWCRIRQGCPGARRWEDDEGDSGAGEPAALTLPGGQRDPGRGRRN